MPSAKTRHEELADKYPTIYSRDGGETIVLGDLVRNFADICELHPDDNERVAEFLDRQFLFGCWGHVMREIREFQFSRDIRGFIFAAFQEGMRRGRRLGEEWGNA